MIIDMSRPIHPGMALYPGNPAVTFESVAWAMNGASALTTLTLGSHTGTHIDAPAHIYSLGAGTDGYALEAMVGPAQVMDLSAVAELIKAKDLPATFAPRVIIKTRNSQGNIDIFHPGFVALAESAAQELAGRGVILVGIDAPSIKKKGAKDSVHKILLDAGMVILEGLWLKDVPAGEYELLCLPLAVVGLNGAPARAILRTLDK